MATVLTRLLTSLDESKEFNSYKTFFEYFAQWKQPKAYSTALNTLFSAKKKKANTEANTFKASASEFLGLYSILAFFLQVVCVPAQHCVKACKVFLELANILDILQCIPLGFIVPDHLQSAIEAFFDALQAAQWEDSFHSKFHWLVHLPGELNYLGCLPSCFCLERKHKAVKRAAQATQNLKAYEAGVLMDVAAQELYDLKECKSFTGKLCLGTHARPSHNFKQVISKYFSFGEVFTSSQLLLYPIGKASKGDFILFFEEDGQIGGGEICLHIELDHMNLWSLIKVCTFDSYNAATCSGCWTRTESNIFLQSTLISQPLIWKEFNGKITTLVPMHLRKRMPQPA